ncbi:sigma-70 family RNA polymerase sigma factor [Colwellia sp. 1_MG-2023]|uniref:RNA polymerase sigma factor n=1 Tax=Colwellia sp. 1_MG-2023 TaxID=3062649 RepID=UPI0026E4784C|nr:sigma-70 family RNA polymerase sigma factor [Colwellia sp. 1_MG-2023]MDO6447390.1 sigma-70 family RNA polymerase sigma factor [Colwellia sp. 1_MG-2023]
MDIWEEQLVDEMKQGCPQAFARCYRLFSAKLYTVIFHICRQPDSAQELLQDTFLDIIENLHCYTVKQSFLAWAKRIAFNNTLNFIKKNNRMVLMEELPQEIESIECSFVKEMHDSRLIESLFAKVGEVERLVLWLFVVEQYNHEEIAILVGKSPSYSKSIVSRTLKKIRLSKEVKDRAYK